MPFVSPIGKQSYFDVNPLKVRNNFTADQNFFGTVNNIRKGFIDENLVFLGGRYIASAIMGTNSTYEIDQSYDVFTDPQLIGLEDYIGQFVHSRNQEHTKYLKEEFLSNMKTNMGSPSYIVGRVLGGLTDPSSLFMFTKAGRFLFTGSRLSRATKSGVTIAAEEQGKRFFDDTRPISYSMMITAGGFIIPAILPALKPSAGKKFDQTADMLDEADDAAFQQGTVGAAIPAGTKIEKVDVLPENQIQPTGAGVFGEQGPYNPIFRVLKNGIASAQEFIERTLEGALYQRKNFVDGVTKPSIERAIKMRFAPLIVETNTAIQEIYNKYLQRLGASKQNFVDRTFDTKFMRGKEVMSPREFREKVFEARMGNKNLDPEVVEAARKLDNFYGPIGKEYDELQIATTFIERYINRLDDIIGKTKNNKKVNDLTKLKEKLEKRLDYIKQNGSLKKNDYINIVYRRDVIDSRFDEFKDLLSRLLREKNPTITQSEIDEIVEGFKGYTPVIQYNNLADEIKLATAKGETVDIDEFINKINKISSRFQSRNLNIDYMKLANAGFIEKDINILQRLYYNQTIPDIEITKIFGDPMGYGTKYVQGGSYQKGIQQISDEYDELIENATSTVQKNKLIKQKEEILVDLDAAIHLLRGTYGLADDPNRFISRGIRIGKLYNALTMLTGIAQTVDVARLVMVNGITRTFRNSYEALTSGYAKEIFNMSKRSAQLGGEALDMWNSSRAMSMYGVEDAFGVFNKFERGFSSLGNLYFTFLNLSNPWNTAAKSIASLFNGTRLIEVAEQIAKGEKVTKVNRARMLNLGINDDMAKQIYQQYQKYGVGKNGKKTFKQNGDDYKTMRVANSDAWDNRAAADAYHNAIGKQSNIDIVTPSKGDVPLWANTELGGTLLQFKKFGIASTQRMLLRGLQERDANFFQGVLLLMAAGAMVDAFRQKAFNRKYENKPLGQKIVDAFDRSGLGGIYSDINNSLERLANNQIGLRPLLGAKKPYGTYKDQRKTLGPYGMPIADILGPSASQIENIADIMFTWGTGKYNHHTARNVRRLVPFQNVWFLDSLFDSMEKNVLR